MRTIAIALGLILAALYLWAVAILSTSQPVDLVWTVAPARTAPLSWMPGSANVKQGMFHFWMFGPRMAGVGRSND